MKLETAFSDGGKSIPVIFSEMGKSLPSAFGNVQTIHDGQNGATFTPSVSEDGVISWENDRELPNPDPVNIKGPKGDPGRNGVDGQPGKDGLDGAPGQPGKDGVDGQPGKDGVSATHRWNGTTLYVTSASGTSSANLKGEKGDPGAAGSPGRDGVNGQPGADGVSPIVSVTAIEGGHRVTITDKNGTKTFDVMDGKDGEDAEGGGTVHWDDVQGKPFGDMPTGGDALQWDGNTDGLLAVTAANRFGEVRTFYKVSDAFPTWGDILQGDFTEVVCRVKKGSETLAEFQSEEEMTAMVDDCLRELGVADDYTADERGKIAVIINEIVCVMEDNYTHGNFVFPEKGTYFSTNVDYLWLRGCTSFPSTKLMDEKYLPMDDITAAVIAALPIYNGEVEEV